MPTDTPRTDTEIARWHRNGYSIHDLSTHSRILERELNDSNRMVASLRDQLTKALEEVVRLQSGVSVPLDNSALAF